MKQSAIVSLAVLGALSPVLAAPTEQTVFGVDRQDDPHPIPDKPNFKFDPLQHLSAMSPYFVPSKEITPLPHPSCNVTTASILIRHSAIESNDDDREQFIQPFVDKVAGWGEEVFPQAPEEWNRDDEIKRWKKEGTWDGDVGERKWWFLKDWETPVTEEVDEVLSDKGKIDAFAFGQAIKSSYSHLFPAPHTGKPHKGKKPLPELIETVDMLETDEFDRLFSSKEKKHKHGKKHGKDKKKHKKPDHKKPPSKDPRTKKPAPPYKLWTASSARDIETATSFIKGAFPKNQTGGDGTGDGYHVQLVKVPNKLGKGWKRSLTPHKACETFTKEPSLEPAGKWLNVFAPKIRERLTSVVPEIAKRVDDRDILAMMMLCAYESIDQGWSGFCGVFTEEELLDGEYYFDVRFHYMMGYGNELSPYLGAPWIKTARHLIAGEVEDDRDGDGRSDDPEHPGRDIRARSSKKGGKKGKKGGKPGDGLPEPRLPPNGTHSQLLHLFFTHRESPAFTSTILNLYNATDDRLGPSADLAPPLDHRPEPRQWRTTELVAFLGHIALERFSCAPGTVEGASAFDEDEVPSFVRVMVNGQQANMHGCESGPKGSCAWPDFKPWMDERIERYSDWDAVCTKDEDDDED